MILTAGYILWTIQRVFLGRSEAWKGLPDMNLREIAIAVPLVVLTIAMGVFPQGLILNWMRPSVDQMAQKVITARELNVPQAGRVTQATMPPGRPAGRVESTDEAALAAIREAMYPAAHIGCCPREQSWSRLVPGIVRNHPGVVVREPWPLGRETGAFAAAPRVAGLPEGLEPCPGWGGRRTLEGAELPCEPGHGWPLSP